MREQEQDQLEQIKDLIRGKKFEELESAWLKVLEEPKHSLDFHQSVIRYLFNRHELDRLDELYALLFETRTGQGEAEFVFQVAAMILELDPAREALRPHLIKAAHVLHADRPEGQVDEFLRVSGLDGETPNIKASVTRLEELLGASRGQVFRHSQWGLGIVREMDAREGWAILDFQKKPNHQMTLDGIRKFLQRIPNDHVMARIARDKDAFRAEVFDDPAATIRLALKSLGGKMKASDLKRVLTDNFLSEAEYKRWWAKAKDEVRLDPYLDQKGAGANQELILRKEPRSFVDEVFEKFLGAGSVADRRAILRDVARHGDNANMTADDIAALYKLFCLPLEDGKLQSTADKFGHGILFEEFAHLFSDEATNPISIDDILVDPDNHPATMVLDLGVFELQRIALEHVARLHEKNAEGILSEVILEADPKLTMHIEKILIQDDRHDLLLHCIERVLARPERNVELFAWAGRKIIDGQFPEIAEGHRPLSICQTAARLLSEAEEQSRRTMASKEERAIATEHATRLRTILQDSHHKYLKKALQSATDDEVRRFLTSAKLLGGLSNQLRSSIEEIISIMFPQVAKSSRGEDDRSRSLLPDSHLTTEASLTRKRQELSHILSVEIPENSKAIGVARELGDLRENAEYHAAKDRQKLLHQRAEELRSLIERATIVDLGNVRTDQVRFGTRATLKNTATGEQEVIVLMGMWEANPEQRVISYLTPFGSQLMNRMPDEEFEMVLPDGRKVPYKVVAIDKALDVIAALAE